MAEKCEFIYDDGHRCGAWSRKDSPYCQAHHKKMLATVEVADFTQGAYFDDDDYCDGLCCSDANHYLHLRSDHWIFVIESRYPARTGPEIQWCPWCGRELRV